MVDVVLPEVRSRMMAGIRGTDTKPELQLRRELHGRGYRYCLHVRSLPGKPDLVLPRFNTAIFVHGCFWHRHAGCRFSTIPKSNAEFWQTKLSGNSFRDGENVKSLLDANWRVAIVWECALRKLGARSTVDVLAAWLHSKGTVFELGVDS